MPTRLTMFCGTCGTKIEGDAKTNFSRGRHVRAIVAMFVVFTIVTMLLGWITVQIDTSDLIEEVLPDVLLIEELIGSEAEFRDVFDSAFTQTHTIYDLSNLAQALNLLLDAAYYMEAIGDDWGESFADIRRLEIISELGGIVPSAADVARNTRDFVADIMENEFLLGIGAIIGNIFGGDIANTVEGMADVVRVLDLVIALIEIEDSEPGTFFADIREQSEAIRMLPMIANIARIVIAVCILLLMVFLYLMLAESKWAGLAGQIGTGLVFLVSAFFVFAVFELNSQLPDIGIGASIWVYATATSSLLTLVLISVYKKTINSAT